jgi:hypothetical protein
VQVTKRQSHPFIPRTGHCQPGCLLLIAHKSPILKVTRQQSDGACLRAEDINWNSRTICFTRKKLKSRGTSIKPTLFRFSADIEALLKRRPVVGPLFPYLCTVRAGDRATEFKQRYDGLGISGVSLHCYRYAWAERALKCGFPERFAQQALGHNSKAVHRAYAKHAEVTVPSLDDWEREWEKYAQSKLLPVNFQAQPVDANKVDSFPSKASLTA